MGWIQVVDEIADQRGADPPPLRLLADPKPGEVCPEWISRADLVSDQAGFILCDRSMDRLSKCALQRILRIMPEWAEHLDIQLCYGRKVGFDQGTDFDPGRHGKRSVVFISQLEQYNVLSFF